MRLEGEALAPLPVISNVSRVCFRWNKLDACNVMHFSQSTIDQDGLYSSISAHVGANMWQANANDWSIQLVEITPLDGHTATRIYVTGSGVKWTGTASVTDIIPAAAAVISWRTAVRGRSYRGRTYIPGVSEGAQTSGLLATSIVTGLATAWGTFLNDMVTASSPVVVASYKHATAQQATSLVVRNEYGIQRRRQTRVA